MLSIAVAAAAGILIAATTPQAETAQAKKALAFDRAAASAALGSVNVQSCKKPNGPKGAGHVNVTFGPSGAVSEAQADTAPYSGTAVGGCVAAKFRGAHVPAFSGPPVTVGKSFTID
jgi:hypothetical protein